MSEHSGSSNTAINHRDSTENGSESPKEDWNYEATVAKIEAIVARIEAGELELAAVFDEFAAAVDYLRQCETFLAQRQQQADLLIETLLGDPEF